MVNEENENQYFPPASAWGTAQLLIVCALIALCVYFGCSKAHGADDAPTLFPSLVNIEPKATPKVEVAPAPRPKAECLCPEGDIRCRIRAAFAFEAAKAKHSAERAAVKQAFEEAARTLAASKAPAPRPKDIP